MLGRVSPRQWEVLPRVMQGERVPDIARDLFVSLSTVRHLSISLQYAFGDRSLIEGAL